MSMNMDEHSRDYFDSTIEDITTTEVYPESKADIIEYYREEYGDKWKSHLVKDMVGFTGSKKPTITKRFDPQRRDNVERRNREQYKDFGKTLNPTRVPKKLPRSGGDVTFQGSVWYSGNEYEKEFTVSLDPDEMSYFLEGNVGIIFDVYRMNAHNIEQISIESLHVSLNDSGPSYGDSSEYYDDEDDE